jgi:glycosyltransferase involved in cell wall biosynthesis
MGIETTYAPWVRSLEEWLRENRGEIDLFLLSRPTVARKCIEVIRRNSPKSPILYYGHDLHFERMKLQAELAGDDELMAESGRMEALERSVWRDVDVVLYPSEEEARRVNELESLVLARPIVPYAFDTFRTRTAPPPDLSLIFVAGFAHPPNVDAAVWLVEEVLPLVRRQLPQVRLSLVGSNPTDQVRALAGPNVDVTGYVTDAELAELYDTARVAIVPLRFGAGVKLKVVEAMQMGVPLVTTWVGGQGLPGLGSVASVQDQPEALARECVNLLQDDARWRRQSASQSEYARSVFSLEAMRASLSDAIDACPRAERDRKLSERRPR